MTTQILRTIDRWRFETPLALALGVSAAFFALTIPAELFERVPVAGGHGFAGRAIVALVLALVAGGVAYAVMRQAGRPAAAVVVADPVEEIAEEDRPSGMPPERLRRFRRADAHPDAPPREPIIASRDLGEPFMEVGGAAPAAPAADVAETWWPETVIPDAEFTDVSEEPAEEAIEPIAEVPEPTSAPAETASIPQAPAEHSTPRTGTSISAMMERLSSGLERRAAAGAETTPTRDMQPALRDALEELNRLAERRD